MRREHDPKRKASRAMDKNAGSVFEQRNALARLRAPLRDEVRNRPRWASQGWRLLRLCLRRMPPEPVRDLNSPAEGSFLEPFFISTQLQAALLAGQRALPGYSSSFSVISLNLFIFWRYLQWKKINSLNHLWQKCVFFAPAAAWTLFETLFTGVSLAVPEVVRAVFSEKLLKQG